MAFILLDIFDWQAINPRFDIASALTFSVGMAFSPGLAERGHHGKSASAAV
jgi:hypothetical protein